MNQRNIERGQEPETYSIWSKLAREKMVKEETLKTTGKLEQH